MQSISGPFEGGIASEASSGHFVERVALLWQEKHNNMNKATCETWCLFYVHTSTHMQHWNAYIGDLQEKTFCWTGNVSDDECTSDRHDQHENNYTNKTIGVWMEFYVGKNLIKKPKQVEKSSREENKKLPQGHLVAALTGSDLETKISSKKCVCDKLFLAERALATDRITGLVNTAIV